MYIFGGTTLPMSLEMRVRAWVGFHMLQHIPSHIDKHGVSVSCFCLERKHKDAKSYMNRHFVTGSGWCGCNLRSITEKAWWHLESCTNILRLAGIIDAAPVNRRSALRELIDVPAGTHVFSSKICRVPGSGIASIGDVVVAADGKRCRVEVFVRCEFEGNVSGYFALVSVLPLKSRDTVDTRVSVHATDGTHQLLAIGDIVANAACWMDTGGELKVVVHEWC